jgi:soluble lytic murein transglycosylase-like protein
VTVPAAVLQWQSTAQKYADEHLILSANEILAIIWSESSGNPKAVNPADPSYGLMQCTMPIGRKYSSAQTPTDLMDPDTNVEAGSGFLAYLKTRYGTTNPLTDPNCAWVAAYNEGEPNLWSKRPDPNYIAAFVSHLNALNSLPEAT